MKMPKDQPFWTSVILHLVVLLALFLVTIVQAFKPKENIDLPGFIFSADTIWNHNLMFLQSFAWIIGAFISLLTYYLLAIK